MTVRRLRRAGDVAVTDLTRRFTVALIANDDAAARQVADDALEAGLGVPAIQSRIIAPAMHTIGQRWEAGTLGVGQEHLATAISQAVLAHLFPHALHTPPRSRERVLLAAAEGEQHTLGLRMVGDLLEGAGFDVNCSDADTSLGALLDACDSHEPAVVGLSATMADHLPALSRETEAVRALHASSAVVVGGQAVTPAIADALGALRVDCSEEAVATVEDALRRRQANPGVRSPGQAGPRRGSRAGETPSAAPPIAIETDGQSFAAYATAAGDEARMVARRAFDMEQMALHDALTGLWNRRAYDARLRDVVAVRRPLGMTLMVDLDEFKRLNDAFGHDTGDATLKDVAQVLLAAVRADDVVARYGGDEFALLLPGARPEEAAAIAERIREAVAGMSVAHGLTVSIGGAPVFVDPRRTMRAADRALYAAKRGGRNRIVIQRRADRASSTSSTTPDGDL